MSLVDLRKFDNGWYNPGRSVLWRVLWMFVGQPLFGCHWLPVSAFRVALLRAFGARIGAGVVIRSGVKVKYPWHLVIGDHCWIGEEAWIDNLTTVRIGSNACVSQGAYLCTGNHDWTDPHFGLMVGPITIGEGAWAGAKCLLAPGATLGSYAVASAGSVIFGHVPDFAIYAGNPGHFVKTRQIRHAEVSVREVVHS